MEEAGGDTDDDSGGTVAAVSRVGGSGGRAGIWGVGWKRIAIAGAAISSAPVVLPPLLLLSAVGLAFSVPMGVFFAGYACTEKIMRSLLPLPALSPAARQPPAEEDERGGAADEEGEEEEVGGEEGVGRAWEEEGAPVEEEPPEAEEKEEEREEKRTVEQGPGPVSEGEGKRVAGKQAVQEEEEECGFPTSEADEVAVCVAAPDREEKRAQAEEEAQGKEGGTGIALVSAPDQEEEKQVEEEVTPFGTDNTSIPEGREAVDNAAEERRQLKEVGEATVLALVVEEIIISAPPPPPEVEGERVEEEETQEAIRNLEMEGLTQVPVERVEGKSIAATEREELAGACPALGHPAALERGSLIELSRLTPESADPVEEQLFGSVEHRELPAVSVSPDSVEDSYDEEKTWEQINALRAIVGYKAPPRSSCMEELKALYLLVGVVPVVSSEESSSLEDVNSELRFLKSIIGVE